MNCFKKRLGEYRIKKVAKNEEQRECSNLEG